MKKQIALFALAAASLLVVSWLTFHIHRTNRGELLSQFNQTQILIARQVSGQIESFLRVRSADLEWLAAQAGRRGGSSPVPAADIRSHLERLESMYEDRIAVIDGGGTVVHSTAPESIGTNHAGSDFFLWAMKPASRASVWIGVDKRGQASRAEGGGRLAGPNPGIVLATPLYGESVRKGDGAVAKFDGVLMMEIDPEKMLAVNASLYAPAENLYKLWIMDRDGTLVLHSEHPEMVARNILERDESCQQCHVSFDYLEKMLRERQGAGEYRLKGSRSKVAAFTTMSLGNAAWIVVVNSPLDEVTASVHRDLRDTLILLGVVISVLCLAFGLAYRNYRRTVQGEMEVRRLRENQTMLETLRETHDYLENLFDNTNAPIIVWSPDLRITRFNRAFERLTGYASGEVIGRELRLLFPADGWGEAFSRIAATLAGECWESVELPVACRGGGIRTLLWSSGNVYAGDRSTLTATIAQGQDITGRKLAEAEQRRNYEVTERMAKEIAILAEIGRIVGSSLEIQEVYEQFAAEARKLIPFDRITVNLKDAPLDANTVVYAAGLDVPGRRMGDPSPVKTSMNDVVIRMRRGLIVQSADGEGLIARFPTLANAVSAGVRSAMSVPLISRNEVIGVLNFQSKHSDAYGERDLHLAESIGSEIAGAVANAQLFAEQKRYSERIVEISQKDQLTNLYNRRGFITLAEQQFKAAHRTGRPMQLTFIDCDDLKWINDTLGHEEGDRALIRTANILRKTFRESDIIARLGGDEFGVLVIDAADVDAERFSQRLQQQIDQDNAAESRPYELSLSWGAAFYHPESPCSIDQLIAAADGLMYDQKRRKGKPGGRS